MIIDIAGARRRARGAISDTVCVGSPVIIKLFTKKVNKQVHQKLEFSTTVGTVVHR